jgi:hypothetical protein
MKKRVLSMFIAVVMMVTMVPMTMIPASANQISGDFEYEDHIDGTVTLIGYVGSGGNVIIPATLDGKTVRRIDGAFRDVVSVVSITLPDTITNIMSDSFWGTTNLTSINVSSTNGWLSSEDGVLYADSKTILVAYPAGKPETSYMLPITVTRLFNGAFFGSRNLETIILHDYVNTIEANAFRECVSLTNITLPDKLEVISNQLFRDSTALTTIVIPESVTLIEDGAFRGCTSLSLVTIPEGVTTLGVQAFANCTNLPSITIPSSVTDIENQSFVNCSQLSSVIFRGNTPPIFGTNIFQSTMQLNTVYVPANSKAAYEGISQLSSYDIIEYPLTVAFDSQGGTMINPLTDVFPLDKILVPDEPIKPTYNFGGWYKEATGINAWNFNNDAVVDSITLFAKWLEIPVMGVSLSQPTMEITKGSSGTLIATITPSNATNQRLIWTSDDETIATVDGNGEVSGVDYGKTTITVTTECGDFYASCEIEVSERIFLVESITLNRDSVTLLPGDSETLRATVYPANATDKTLTWVSNNGNVTVNDAGLITPVLFGDSIITVSATDGSGETAICTVLYKPFPPQVRIDRSNLTFSDDGFAIFTDADGSALLSWEPIGERLLSAAIDVQRNRTDEPSFFPTGNSQSIPLATVSSSNLWDDYVVRVTVANEFGDSATDNISLRVYNSTALSQQIPSSIVIDNSTAIAGKTSGEILAIRDKINLTLDVEYVVSFPWTSADGLTWEIANDDIAKIFTLSPSAGWIEVSPGTSVPPTAEMRIVGYENGSTSFKVTHELTGMYVDVPVTVATLEDKLFIFDSTPARVTQITYTNGANEEKTVSSDNRGFVAIYETTGINSDVTFRAVNGDETWVGTIRQENLISGENQTELYPVNPIRLTLLSNITLFVERATGGRYRGDVQIAGGLFINDVFIESSRITEQMYNNSTDTSGRIFIQLDTASLGALNPQDSFKYKFEMRFLDGNFAPVLFEIDAILDATEALQSNAFTVFINEWDKRNPYTSFRFNGQDVSNQANIGLSDDNTTGTLRVYAAIPNNKTVSSAHIIRRSNNTLLGNQNFTLSSYPFLSDISYVAIDWNLNNSTVPVGTTEQFNVEFEYTDGTRQTVRMPFGISNTIGLSVKANEAAFLKIPVRAHVSNSIASVAGFTRSIPFVPTMPGVNIQVRELDFNVAIEATSDPMKYKLYGYFGAPHRTTSLLFRNEFRAVQNDVRVQKFGELGIDLFEKPLPNLPKKSTLSADISVSAAGVKAYVEGELIWNPINQKFDMIITEGDMIGGTSLAFGITITVPVWGVLNIRGGLEAGVATEFSMQIFNNPNEILVTNRTSIHDRIFAGPSINLILLKGGIDVWGQRSSGYDDGSRYNVLNRTHRQASRLSANSSIGVDAWAWTGIQTPRIKLFGRTIVPSITITLLNLRGTLWSQRSSVLAIPVGSGDQTIWNQQGLISASTPLTYFEDFDEEMFLSPFLPIAFMAFSTMPDYPEDDVNAIVEGDNTFAVAAWETLNPHTSEDFFEDLDGFEDLDDGDEVTVDIDELIGIMNLSEIAVSVFDGSDWTEALLLTDNNRPDGNPIVAADTANQRATVVWQRQTLQSDGDYSLDSTTELWYSVYENGDWSEPAQLDFIGDDLIADYRVEMNEHGFAVIADVYNESNDEVSDIAVYFIDWNDEINKNVLTSGSALCVNPQIIKAQDGFYLSWYQFSENNGGDIIVRKLLNDGTIDNLNVLRVNDVSGLSLLNPNMIYELVGDGTQAAILCRAFDFDEQGDALYAIKVLDVGGEMSLSAPLTLVEAKNGYALEITGGELSGSQITVNYNEFEVPEEDTDVVLIARSATKTFENTFVGGATFNAFDVNANNDLLVTLSAANTGINTITSVEIKIDGDTYFDGSRFIAPGNVSEFDVMFSLGETLQNYAYTITVQFSNGQSVVFNGTLQFAKTDVSFGLATPLLAENGVRTVSLNLFNDSDVPLKNSGFEIRLTGSEDLNGEFPITLDGQTSITSNEDLELIDEGGLNLLFSYTIPEDRLEDGEIPDFGLWIYIHAEIWDGTTFVEQRSYVANQVAIGFNSLIQHGEPAQFVLTADTFDNSTGTFADLQVINLSMQPITMGYGKINVDLFDENDNVIESKSMLIESDLLSESITAQNIQFEQTGAYVLAEFEATTPITMTVATPTASPNGGTFTESQNITLSVTTAGATIFYTLDGSNPTTSSVQYSGAFTITNTTTVRAIAVKSGMKNSSVMSATFTITTSLPSVPSVTSISAGTTSIASGGGSREITITGTNLINGISVRAVQGSTTISGTTTGNSTSQSVTLNFPANTSTTTVRTFNIQVSLDGSTWLTTPTATVTVARRSSGGGIIWDPEPVTTTAVTTTAPITTTSVPSTTTARIMTTSRTTTTPITTTSEVTTPLETSLTTPTDSVTSTTPPDTMETTTPTNSIETTTTPTDSTGTTAISTYLGTTTNLGTATSSPTITTTRPTETIPPTAFEEILKQENPVIVLKELDGSKLTDDMLQAIAENGKNVVVDLGNGYKFTIVANSITENAKALDLNIAVDLTSRAGKVNGVKIPGNAIVIAPNHIGDFGFEIQFTFTSTQLAEKGLNANSVNLYYVNHAGIVTKKDNIRVVNRGVVITISHASQYILSVETPISAGDSRFRLGDVNGDGKITIGDALEILKFLAKLPSTVESSTLSNHAASIVSKPPQIGDALEILKRLAGLPSVVVR